MTAGKKERRDVGEEAIQGEVPLEEAAAEGTPAKGRHKGWIAVVAVLAAILVLCTIVVCIAAAVATFSGAKDETSAPVPTAAPAPTAAPVPTKALVQAMIAITEPDQGQVVDISKPVKVQGKGAGLAEGNVVVEALDWQGNLLARVPTTLQGQDVGTGGEGAWRIALTIEVEPGTAGRIRAYSTSPKDGSVVAEDTVEVSLGQTPAVQSYLKIDAPGQGETLDIGKPVQVSGTGAGLPEGNVVVVAVDQDGDVLAEQPATLQGPDVDTGGEGTWSVELAVLASGQTPGYIAAFSTSPQQRSLVASDHVQVTFAGEYRLEGTTWLLDKTIPGSEITAEFAGGQVAGTAGCNAYNGTYRSTRAVGRNTLEIGPLATTRMMCDGPIMDQEGLYLAALDSATGYTIEGFTLSITYPGGSLLFYDKDGPRPRR
jgi:heat shock protein HslJ